MERFRYDLNIADIQICIQTDHPLLQETAFQPFLNRKRSPQYTVSCRQVASLPPIPEQILHEGVCDRVHPDGKGGWLRSFFDAPRSREPYAVGTYDYPGGTITIEYLESGKACVDGMSNTFYHLGIEALLMQEQKFCFHAACIQTDFRGILFSGPSGIGKSTQADLWCRHRGSRMLNGDRPILGKENGIWTAWGSPYAGSSRCYVDESCPIAAIVMLRQSPKCSVRRLEKREGFRRIYSGLTVYSWNEAFSSAAFDCAVNLAGQVPIYELCCTPDEAAVECLEAELRKEITL